MRAARSSFARRDRPTHPTGWLDRKGRQSGRMTAVRVRPRASIEWRRDASSSQERQYAGRMDALVPPVLSGRASFAIGVLRGGRDRAGAALAPWPLKLVVDNVLSGQPLPESLRGPLAQAGVNSAVTLLVVIVARRAAAADCKRSGPHDAHTAAGRPWASASCTASRSRLLAHLQALPLRHHLATRTADSVYRLDADAHCVDDLLIGGVFPLAVAVVNLAVMFTVLATSIRCSACSR